MRLDVSTRTIRSDIDKLRSLGYPVEATPGAAGGYRLGAGADLPPLLLDDDEAVAVAVGLRSAADGGIAGIEETSIRALAKLERVLPVRLRRRVKALHAHTVSVSYDVPAPAVQTDVLATMSMACRDRERVRFGYRDHEGRLSRRAAEPYRLVRWGRRWYLVAWDLDREDWRTFRADRIEDATAVGTRFAPRQLPAVDLAAYVSSRASSTGWRYRAKIRLHAPAARLTAKITPAVGTLREENDDTCVLDTGADSLDTIAVAVSMIGVDFEVLEPVELIEHIGELADRYRRAVSARRG